MDTKTDRTVETVVMIRRGISTTTVASGAPIECLAINTYQVSRDKCSVVFTLGSFVLSRRSLRDSDGNGHRESSESAAPNIALSVKTLGRFIIKGRKQEKN